MTQSARLPKLDAPPPSDPRDPRLLDRARRAFAEFELGTIRQGPEAFGNGHLNRTYVVSSGPAPAPRRYLLQILNTFAFREPFGLMDNIVRVTEHIARRLAAEGLSPAEIARRAPAVHRSRAGTPYFIDEEGGFWRVFDFVENATVSEVCATPAMAFTLGAAAGRFQNLVSDLPGPRLVETIPGFHNARKRYAALERAIGRDSMGRRALVQREIDFYAAREKGFDILVSALESGLVPERITHNDTKMNNLLLDRDTGEAICIVDMDTVMPGTSVYDFGDLARTAASSTAEDDPDPGRMEFVPAMYEAIARGYARGSLEPGKAGSFLTPEEQSLVPESGRILAMLMGVRFLTDFLEGDQYYHIDHPTHNLDRTRTQAALIASMEKHRDWMIRTTEAAFREI